MFSNAFKVRVIHVLPFLIIIVTVVTTIYSMYKTFTMNRNFFAKCKNLVIFDDFVHKYCIKTCSK